LDLAIFDDEKNGLALEAMSGSGEAE